MKTETHPAAKAAHTPEWRVVMKPEWLPDDDISIVDEHGRQVCCVRRLSGYAEQAETQARLIASAPALKEALETMLEMHEAYFDTSDVANADIVDTLADARAALERCK